MAPEQIAGSFARGADEGVEVGSVVSKASNEPLDTSVLAHAPSGMALFGLMTRGIRSTLEEHRAALEPLARGAGLPEGAGEHLAQTLEAMPGLLVALDRAVQGEGAPTQALWAQLVSYLLLDEDLIPSRDGAPIEGLLDDVYLVHVVVERMMKRVASSTKIDVRSVAGGAQLLRAVLPASVTAALDARVDEALRRA